MNKDKKQLETVAILNNGIMSMYKTFDLSRRKLESKVFENGFLSLETLNNLAQAMELLTTRLRKGFCFEFTFIRMTENKLAFLVSYRGKSNESINSVAYVIVNLDKTNIENDIENYGRVGKINIIEDSFEVNSVVYDNIETFEKQMKSYKMCILDTFYFKNFEVLQPTSDVNNTIYDIEIKQRMLKIETKGEKKFSCPVESDFDFNFQLNWIQLFYLLNDFISLENKYRKIYVNDNYLKMEAVSKADDLRYTSAFVL